VLLLQVHQQELGAQIRLPPLNPKATAPLKHLAAGMGSLFAGPVDDASLLLQWSPSSSGSTLPIGGSAHRREDHDSAAAAALGSGSQHGSASSSKGRVSCVLFGAVPGRLWAGCADGKLLCWEAAGDGSVARLLHSWEAHSGKVKGLALSPSGRLFTGACVLLLGLCVESAAAASLHTNTTVQH
jgi:WD40 repeat protein